jgi:uncharacterized membrane protein
MERPRINIDLDPVDWMIEIMGLIFILGLIGIPMHYYDMLPETIPIHFNAAGEADGFGSRNSIWSLPIIGVIIYVGMFALNRFPYIFNYPVEITEENAEKQYRNATKLIRMLNLIIAATFLYISYFSIRTSLGISSGLGWYFTPIFLGGTFLTIGIYLYLSFKSKK